MAGINNLEGLLSSGNINKSVIEIDNFICELCELGDKMDALTEAQKTFFHIQNLEREVNNGGFNQYFTNSSGDFAHETVKSLRIIGANHTADILQLAIDQFPNQKVPQDRRERIELVGQNETVANDKWEDLDQKFFEYKDDLNSLNMAYVRKYQTEF